ncbi:MAG TPA: GntR family transcriptional regulator [Firmicutes bacterium]|nr:GntR family transcriptional regulator [Candidatus Fermentithermobacillaceae bacterium]
MVELTPVDITDPRPIRDIVHDILRSAIIGGRFVPGDRLVESQLAQQLCVSRTPVREALRMLVKDGFAVEIPRRGTVVAGLNRDDAIDIYDLRAVIEGLCARRAASNITARELRSLRNLLESMRPGSENREAYMKAHARFNAIIIGASRSHRIAQFIDNLAGQIRCLRGVSLTTQERQKQAWEEHAAIVEALAARDGERAEQLARQHAENAKKAFLLQWK